MTTVKVFPTEFDTDDGFPSWTAPQNAMSDDGVDASGTTTSATLGNIYRDFPIWQTIPEGSSITAIRVVAQVGYTHGNGTQGNLVFAFRRGTLPLNTIFQFSPQYVSPISQTLTLLQRADLSPDANIELLVEISSDDTAGGPGSWLMDYLCLEFDYDPPVAQPGAMVDAQSSDFGTMGAFTQPPRNGY